MSGQLISDDRILALIETYGADPHMFPEEERAAARARMKAHPEHFSGAIAAAREIDALLGEVPDVVTSESLRDALIASAPKAAPARIADGRCVRRYERSPTDHDAGRAGRSGSLCCAWI